MKTKLFLTISMILMYFCAAAQTGIYVPELAKFDTAMLNLMSTYNSPGGNWLLPTTED